MYPKVAFNKKMKRILQKIFIMSKRYLPSNKFEIYLTIKRKMDLLALK